MRRVLLTVVLTILVTLALVWLAIAAAAWTGAVSVAATADYVPGAEWFFSTLSEQSIRRHAADAVEEGVIEPPERFTEAMVRSGAAHYPAMCVPCHGGPGVPRGEWGKGMKPRPPELSHVAAEWGPAEIYWVLDHGIRHTGMPAFGATHSPEELWGLVAFVEQLDGMSPEEYRRLAGSAGGGHGHGGGGHEHGGQQSGGRQSGGTSPGGEPAEAQEGETTHDHSTHEH